MTDILHGIVDRLHGARKSGNGWMARCPAHDDGKASLSIGPGRAHPVVLNCMAGCDPNDVLAELGLTWADLSEPKDDATHHRTAEAGMITYDYRDEGGKLLFQVCRKPGKKFAQRVPDGGGGWVWKLGDTRRVMYRLPEIIKAIRDGRMIYICEGEKDVHTLVGLGLAATCNPGGAGSWRPEYAEVFREAVVTIIADRDDQGQAHARQIRDSLLDGAASITIVEALAGKDATDHVEAGRSVADFATLWTNDVAPKPDLAPDLWEFIGTEDPPYDWVVPGLLERGDRLMLTGFEGLGKSMLSRQLVTMIAAGLHPFQWSQTIDPRKVLMIDCENSERQSRRKFRPLAAASIKYGHRVPDGGLRLIHRPEGLDLTKGPDAEWLAERVTAHKPDVLYIGPFYRLHTANINEELPARKTVKVLDDVRTSVDCVMVIEAHSGHGEQGKNRSVRPAGSSLLLRWPEFGFGLAPCGEGEPGQPCMDVEIRHWRGQRDEREWPTHLTWGGPGNWPWQVAPGPDRKLRAV